jgi:hypothetical protein
METSIAMPIRRNDEHTTTIYFLLIRRAQQHRLLAKALHLRHGDAARRETILMFPVIGHVATGTCPTEPCCRQA